MALSYESIIASAPLRFLVGSNKRLFTVHAAVITHHSKSLGDLINGGMSEANEGCALLEDVEESTFIRFSQYAYTGEYIAADPEILFDSSTIASPSTWSKPAPSTDNAWFEAAAFEESPSGFNTASILAEAGPCVDTKEPEVVVVHSKKKSKIPKEMWGPKTDQRFFKGLPEDYQDERESALQSRKERLWKLFVGRTYNVSTPSFHLRRNRESCEDYTDVFLCHTRLYVFADKWDIGLLKQLSLHKLQQTLSVFTLYKEHRHTDAVQLRQHSPCSINRGSFEVTTYPLRDLCRGDFGAEFRVQGTSAFGGSSRAGK